MRRSIWLFALLMITTATAGEAFASYASYFKQGQREQKRGHHREAIALFDKALAVEARPGAKYFKALSLMALKRWTEARTLLLAVEADGRTPAPVRLRIPALRATINVELGKQRGSLSVTTRGVEGASVLIDGRVIGLTPLVGKKLPTGTFQLAIRANGYRPHVESVTIDPGAVIRREITLVALPVLVQINTPGLTGVRIFLDGKEIGTAPLALRKLPGRYRLRAEKEGHQATTEVLLVTLGTPVVRNLTIEQLAVIPIRKVAPREPSKALLIAGYVTGGLGLALLATGGAFHGLAVKDRNASADLTRTLDDARSKYNASKTKIKVAYALYGIGGASLISGVVLLVLHYTRRPAANEKPNASTERWQLVPTVGGGSLRLRF